MKQKTFFFKTLSVMLFFVLFASNGQAQEISVTGTVTDEFGPVAGATIQVKGSNNGCTTDIDGNFTLPKVGSTEL